MRDLSASESGVTTVTTTVIQSNGQCRNAFQIMMAAQAELCSKQLPDVIYVLCVTQLLSFKV